MEIALGLEIIALIHVIGNAFLRSYQLLVSPSMVSYKIRQQQYVTPTEQIAKSRGGGTSLGRSIYLLSLKEWNMDFWVDRVLWNPFRKIGRLMNRLPIRFSYLSFVVLIFAVTLMKLTNVQLSSTAENVMTGIYLTIALLISVQAFTGKRNFFYNWNLVFANHILTMCAVYIHHHNIDQHFVMYLSGVIISFVLGVYCLNQLKKQLGITSMYGFKGRIHNNYFQGGLFLIACLGMAGFPVTPTFIGEDLFFTGLEANQWFLAVLMAFSFIINGLALIRMFARIYLGNQISTDKIESKRSA